MTEVVLVSCSKSKRDGVQTARDLYDESSIYCKRRELAQVRGDHWGILSAKYGYLRPWDTIEDYERHITERSDVWAAFVLRDLRRDLDHYDADTVTILAGSGYVDPLVAPLESDGYDVIDFNRGKRPGERQQALDAELESIKNQSLEAFV